MLLKGNFQKDYLTQTNSNICIVLIVIQVDVNQYIRALKTLKVHETKNSLLRMDFCDALNLFEDCTFDFIYIDGYAHTGENEGKTLYDWYPKLKKGGMFAGDDYHNDWPKVVHHVDEFCKANLYIITSLRLI